MTGNSYQEKACRTINQNLNDAWMEAHALFGMTSEIGEICSLYQKQYQGHLLDLEHAKEEVGDLLWFIAEYCTAHGWWLEDIMQQNIEKLMKRYPNGFEKERSVNRDNEEEKK